MKTSKINWSLIFEVVVLLATLAFGYGMLNNKVSETKEDMIKIEVNLNKRIDDLIKNITETNAKMGEISTCVFNLNGNIQRLIGTVESYRRAVNDKDSANIMGMNK